MTQRLIAYTIGCRPSPSIPAETLLQDCCSTFLLFFAVSESVGTSGYLDELGVAVLEPIGCVMTKFGYPNDEGLPEHPLYQFGLADGSPVKELVNSAWAKEVAHQIAESSRRIWGAPSSAEVESELRHFVIRLKEKTFECLASQLVVKKYAKGFPEAFAFVQAQFAEN